MRHGRLRHWRLLKLQLSCRYLHGCHSLVAVTSLIRRTSRRSGYMAVSHFCSGAYGLSTPALITQRKSYSGALGIEPTYLLSSPGVGSGAASSFPWRNRSPAKCHRPCLADQPMIHAWHAYGLSPPRVRHICSPKGPSALERLAKKLDRIHANRLGNRDELGDVHASLK